jgi:small-conductance mechanosensitive channel
MTLHWSDLAALAVPAALTVAGYALGLLVRRTVFARLARVASGTRSELDDLMVAALRGPLGLWGATLGLYVATGLTRLPDGVARVLQRSILALFIFSITWALAGLAAGLVRARTGPAHRALPSVTLLPNLARGVVLVIGLLVILDTLGISITPIITALGVGGLAVALALQDTLSNLFAGVHVLLSRQVRPGDFIQLGSGEQGYVQDVTWRYTTIRQLPNNITVVPNSKLASAITTNYYLPEQEMGVLVQVGVSYGSDLAQVERVTIEVGREVMREVQGGVPAFEPFIRYHTFGDSSINFTVILRTNEFTGQYLVKHEFIKRLHRRYRDEGIEIPFPIRTLEWKGGGPIAAAPPAAGER